MSPGTRVAAIVLAAGRSARMGPERNKLVEPIAGRPLVAWPVDALLEAGVERVFVVVGFEAERVREALHGRACRFVEHAAWPEGMGRSLARGMHALLAEAPLPEAVLVCVGDLPGLRAEDVEAVVDAARSNGPSGAQPGGPFDPERIVVPVFAGRRGHPVCFGARHFEALARCSGDEGARAVLERESARLIRVERSSDSILRDADTYIIGGGVCSTSAEFRSWYLGEVKRHLILPGEMADYAKLELMEDGDEAGARGAALYARDEVRK